MIKQMVMCVTYPNYCSGMLFYKAQLINPNGTISNSPELFDLPQTSSIGVRRVANTSARFSVMIRRMKQTDSPLCSAFWRSVREMAVLLRVAVCSRRSSCYSRRRHVPPTLFRTQIVYTFQSDIVMIYIYYCVYVILFHNLTVHTYDCLPLLFRLRKISCAHKGQDGFHVTC